MVKKIISVFSIVMLVSVFLVSFIMSSTSGVYARELSKEKIVDAITLESSEIYMSGKTKITVSFSEKDNVEIYGGDTITLDLPPELIGYGGVIQLSDFGEAVIEGGKVVVTFNENTDSKENIKGEFTFTIKSINQVENDSQIQIPMDLGTGLIVDPLVIKGYPSSSGNGNDRGPTPFAYKGGESNPNNPEIIKWYIVVNPDRLQIEDQVVLTDVLGEGQNLLPKSFKLNGVPIEEYEKHNHGIVELSDNDFTVYINQVYIDEKSLSITYETKINEHGKNLKELDNKFEVKYQEKGKVPNSLSGRGIAVNDMAQDGKAQGDEEETTPTSVEESSVSSTEETASTSVEESSVSSTEETASTSVEESSVSSTEETTPTSVEESSVSSTKETPSTSIKESSVSSTEETASTSVRESNGSSTKKTNISNKEELSFISSSSNDSSENSNQKLPDTGATSTVIVQIIGWCLLLFVSIFTAFKVRRSI
ncbi:collagen binding domain-containing protein [Enterococcus faecalis]|uniref:collagen binding domain-containing protein n=1 Tax=Enterococcus faecalis TaxID=1351 RepID=UPI0029358777|nr:collagen binding domain-containing protein [Enterococcus faecalis]MDV2933831.1 collagen binding domain-containing protein [Enterococcus faecalis]